MWEIRQQKRIQVVSGILIVFDSLLFSIADVLKRSAPHYLLRWSVGLILKTSAKEAGFPEDLSANLPQLNQLGKQVHEINSYT